MKLKKTMFVIDTEQKEKLRAYSERADLSMSQVVRRAIDAYLEQQGPQCHAGRGLQA